MKKLSLVVTIIFLSIFSFSTYGAEIKLSNYNVDKTGSIAWSNCIYLNRGPEKPYDNKKLIKDYINEHYRVGFILHEIYYDISIEKIITPNEEGEVPIITNSYNVNGFELADKLGIKNQGEVITDIEFVKWNSWNSFTLMIHKKKVRFKILENSLVEVTFSKK